MKKFLFILFVVGLFDIALYGQSLPKSSPLKFKLESRVLTTYSYSGEHIIMHIINPTNQEAKFDIRAFTTEKKCNRNLFHNQNIQCKQETNV